MWKARFTSPTAIALFVVIIVGLFGYLNLRAPMTVSTPPEDPVAAERVNITTKFVHDCVNQHRDMKRESDVRLIIGNCVNERLAKEGKRWRWEPGANDFNVK